MTEPVSPVESQPPIDVPVNRLREARQAKGMHLATLAVFLKVPLHRLEALEQGRYDDLPDAIFARALAISMCKALDVDPAPILANLPAAQVVRLAQVDHAINIPMPHTLPSMWGSGSTWAVPMPLVLACVLLLAAVGLWFVLPLSERSPDPESSSTAIVAAGPEMPAATLSGPSESTALPELLELPELTQALQGAEGEAVSRIESTPENVALNVTPLDPLVAPPHAPAETEPTQSREAATVVATPMAMARAAGTLTLQAQDTSWVEVTGASGRVWLQRSLQAGESVGFSEDFPMEVVIGRADQVVVMVRDEAFDIQSLARGNVARFDIR